MALAGALAVKPRALELVTLVSYHVSRIICIGNSSNIRVDRSFKTEMREFHHVINPLACARADFGH